jgi:hypothetical protein
MIHYSGPEEDDGSVAIILDLIQLQKSYPNRIICLLGNHEFPHIYSITLQKGDDLFTPRFERNLKTDRDTIISFFNRLPFYIRTAAGVSLCHAGATPAIHDLATASKAASFSHQTVLNQARESIAGGKRPSSILAMQRLYQQPYDTMVKNYFDIQSQDDPRYDDFLIGTIVSGSSPDFAFLWDILFSKNEKQYGKAYTTILGKMLDAFSQNGRLQTYLVSGHIDVSGGHQLINNKQLRLASGKHANPHDAAQYLIFNTGAPPIPHITELTQQLGTVR